MDTLTRIAIRGVGTFLMLWLVVFSGRAQQLELHGFAQVNYAARVTGAACPVSTACDIPLADDRLQLKLEAYSEDGMADFAARVDFFHDGVTGASAVELRETYLNLLSDNVTLRAGRQIITWGVGDLLFVNDIFPKDWRAFFLGRPLQYLKVGTSALKGDLHAGPFTAEVVLAPFFQADRFPTGERLLVSDPFPAQIPRRVDRPDRSFENVEVAARLSRYVLSWEIAAYASRTFYRTPAARLDNPFAPTEVRLFFPRLNTFGASLAGGLFGGVLTIEGAYYDSRMDPHGSDPAIENSQLRGLFGYQHSLWEDAVLGIQGYLERMEDHEAYLGNLPDGAPTRDEISQRATLRFRQLLLHQTLTLNVFAFWGITERDAYLIPSIRYAFTDDLWGEVGANVFWATDNHTSFGRLEANDNLYLALRFAF